MQEQQAKHGEQGKPRKPLNHASDLRVVNTLKQEQSISFVKAITFTTALLLTCTVMLEKAHAQNVSTVPNVTKETRARVERISLDHLEFKLSPEAQECMDGKVIDPECDPVINGEADLFLKKLRVAEKERAVAEEKGTVAEREREVTNVNLARDHIGVVLGLVQLGLFAFDDRAPPKNADFVSQVMESQSTSTEVRSLFNDFLGRKKRGEKFASKTDSQRLIGLANKHLESANLLKAQITKNETFKKQIAAMYLQAASSLEMAKQILAKKSGQ